ncbi:MAG: hypothetical protein AB3N06_08340, partial [Erythrobacter sp.]
MRSLFLPLAVLALAACSSEPSEQASAGTFADRIGQGGDQAAVAQADPGKPNTAVAVPPAGTDLTSLQKLGDIGGVDLGSREGGCTLMVGNDEMIVAGGVNDGAIPGKAVVRLGDSLVVVDAAAGGLDAVRDGTTFDGEGFTISVAPAAGEQQTRPA